MSNLKTRTITGFFIILFIVGSLIISKVTFYFFGVLLIYLALREFYQLTVADHIKPFHQYGALLGIIIFSMFYVYCQKYVDEKIFLPLIPLTLSLFIIELYRKNKHPFHNIAYTILGLIYIALPFSLLNFMVFSGKDYIQYQYQFILFFFILVWTYDTMAYVFGLLLGKKLLFSRISPKKTWGGAIGGALSAVGISILLAEFYKEVTVLHWIVIALIIAVIGTYGDLTESLYKRSINTKESGYILPGHGGILDRFDTILFSAPFVFMYIKLIS